MLLTDPDLRDPDGIRFRGVVRDDIAETTRHAADAFEQYCHQSIALARNGNHFPNESVHCKLLWRGRSLGGAAGSCQRGKNEDSVSAV